MSYESADYINQLNPNLPLGSDSVSEGDIHLRLLKEVLQQSFPNVNEPVNAIHTGDTAPTLHSAGTVWFDTSTGLVKMRDKDDTVWLKMAHGEANGVGQLLKVDWFEWNGASYRNATPTLLEDDSDPAIPGIFTINPLSDTSTYFINATAEVESWTYGSKQDAYNKFRDDTTDIDISDDTVVTGFQHVDDGGNFEVRGMMNMKFKYQNHPSTPWDLAIYGWCYDADGGGSGVHKLKVEVLEIE